MAFVPLALAAIPAIMSAISGGVGIASAVKQLKGGRIRRHRHVRARPGKGLSPMKIYRPYCGYGLLKPAGGLLHPAGYGYGLSPMKIYRPYAGYGLHKRKAPKRKHMAKKRGGKVHHRKRHAKRGHGMLYPPGGHQMALLKKIAHSVPYLQSSPPPLPMSATKGITKFSVAPPRAAAMPMTPLNATHALGGRLARMHLRRRGKGAVADFLSGIPLLGAIAGPIARALGGRIHKRKHHVVKRKGGRVHKRIVRHKMPKRHIGGRHGNTHRMSETIKAILRGGAVKVHHRRGHYKHIGHRRVHVPATVVHTGGALVHRRGHYKHVAGRRVHVRPTTVHRGGYMPYTWRA